MGKFSLFFVFFFLFLSPVPSFAQKHDIDLHALHGENLDNVPFVMRYKYRQATGLEWVDSDYLQREEFLDGWYNKIEEEAEALKNKARQEKEQSRKTKLAKDAARRDDQQKKIQEQRQERLAQQVERLEQREFQRKVRERELDLKQLRKGQRKCKGTCS